MIGIGGIEMLKVAVVGMRGIGNIHAAAYQASPLAKLVAVCDLVKERADQAAARFGVKAYYDLEKMLDIEKPDIVSVATGGEENGGDHYVPVMAALEAGAHVLCEKPISNRIEEARAMVAKAREKGAYFGIDLNHRFVPLAERAKSWIEEGRLGHLLLMNMTLWIDNSRDTSPWFHIRALHPHSLDVMRYFCGPITKVQAFFNRAPGRVCYSNVQINMEFASGVIGHLTGSYDANQHHNLERAEVMGTEGRFFLNNCFEELVFYPRRSDECTVIRNSIMGGIGDFQQTMFRRIHRFVEQVSQGVPKEEIEASGEDGLAVQEVIEAAIRSFETGTVVNVPRL